MVLSTLVTEPMDHLSQSCPNGMMPNPAGYYGCVPKRSGGNAVGGNPVGTPTQEMITVCGGNYYTCIWPYGPVV